MLSRHAGRMPHPSGLSCTNGAMLGTPFRPLFRCAFSGFLGRGKVVWYEYMNALKETIIEKLDSLPDPALRLVMDYLTFLTWRGAGEESSLLSVAGQLSGTPMSAAEIERELYGQRETEENHFLQVGMGFQRLQE